MMLTLDPGFAGSLVETMAANDLRVQAAVHPDSPPLEAIWSSE